jgi:hypothetical protein
MQDQRSPRRDDTNFLSRCFNMNPRNDRKTMTKIVARAMIDSLDQGGLGLESGMTYVPVMVRLSYRIVYWSSMYHS